MWSLTGSMNNVPGREESSGARKVVNGDIYISRPLKKVVYAILKRCL